MNIASIGIDLGKTTFHLVALGERNKILLRRKFSRTQLLAYTANLPASLIGLEACAGSHFIGAVLREQGHQVRLIPAQFVKPYRKSNKNDFIDAEAIAEAVTKQNMRFVQIKTQEQLDWQAMHRVRDRLMQRRTALINEIRGFLLERGLTFAARPIYLRKNLPTVINNYRRAWAAAPVLAAKVCLGMHREIDAELRPRPGHTFHLDVTIVLAHDQLRAR